MNIAIREGIYSDAYGIASVQVRTWQSTYRGIISDEYLDGLNISKRVDKWGKILSDSTQKVFVVLDGDNIVGFATCGKSDTLEGYDSTISSIYVGEKYQGKGIGRDLFRTAIIHLKSLGSKSMYLWVLADNPAQKFYEKMGGEYTTQMEVLIGEEKYTEHRYDWSFS